MENVTSLSEFDRALRNTNERVTGFNEEQDRLTSQERAAIIEAGVEQQKGDRVIQIELDDLSRRDLQRRINNLKGEISQLEKNIKSPALAPGVERITQQLAEKNIPLNEDSLQRIIDESTVEQDRDAAKTLLTLRRLQAESYQYGEQLAQNILSNRTTLIDFNRTISDYFFRLTQEIKEARVEVERLINQLFYGNIKSRLRSAIAPGTESFLNGIIEGVQGVIDQAASIAEKVLGQDSALIGFETKQYDLQTQLQDFARQIAGASDAVGEFIRSLQGQGRQGGFQRSSGKPTFPVAGLNLSRAKITSGYGWRNIFGRKDFHEGIDIAVPGGTKVVAANAGIVKYIKPLADQMQVGVESINSAGEKVQEWYIHLARNLNVKIGDRILAGQQIGSVASTSNVARRARVSTGDHLDYRVMVNAKWVNPKQFLSKARANAPTSKNSISNTSDILKLAGSLKQERLSIEADKIDLQGMGIELDRQNLNIDIEQLTGRNTRTFETQAREAERAAQQLRDRFTNIGLENQLPTAEGELEKNLINARSQFRDFDNEIFQQLQRLNDFVLTAIGFIQRAPEAIAEFRARGTDADLEAARFIEDTVKQTRNALPGYIELIKEITKQQKGLPEREAQALKFIEEQGKLKIEQQKLGKQSELSQLRLNIATARGTNEERRQLEIAAERLRLEERINQIKQQYGNSEYARQLIEQEKRNSQIKEEEINRDAESRDLNYEQQLINLQSGIKEKQASILDNIGATFEANRLRREAAIAQEMQRYKQEIAELEKTYAGEPEKLKKLKEEAKKLNQVNLAAIKQQFKSLGGEIKKLAYNATESFFTNLLTNLFEGQEQKQQQILEANLDYAQKLNEAYEKFKNNPAELAQAKNRLKELNNQKLDGIREEFNLFNRVVNFAKQALSEFFKSIAQMMAKKVTAGIFKFIGGLGLGFADGGTVPNFATGGTVEKNHHESRSWGNTDISRYAVVRRTRVLPNRDALNRIVSPGLTSVLSKSSKPIRSAFSREGNKGVLAVFTPGEEILSLKTGEAQRYQALKQAVGINPLQEIFAGNFANGGTIEGNLLSNIGTRPSSVRFDSGSLNRGTTNNITRSGTLNINVTTPNADSFRASEHQLGLDAAESLRRSMKRN